MDQKPFIPSARPLDEPEVPQVKAPIVEQPIATSNTVEAQPQTQTLAAPTSIPNTSGTVPQATPAPAFAPAKKSKNGLKIALAVILAVIVCGIVVAFILLSQPKKDPVKSALENFFDNAEYIHTDGNISIENEDMLVNLSIDSDLSLSNRLGKATIEASTDIGGKELSISLDAITDKNDKNYLKVSGLTDFFKNTGLDYMLGSTTTIAPLLSVVDDNWFSLDQSEISSLLSSGIGAGDMTESAECFAEISPFNKTDLKNSLMENYFFNKTQENSTSRYSLSVDEAIFNNFLDSITKSNFITKTLGCLDTDIEDLKDNITLPEDLSIPSTSVTVKDNQITTLHMDWTIEDVSINLDLSLSYPSEIEIETPKKSSSIMELFNPNFLMNLLPTDNNAEIIVEDDLGVIEEE